MLNFVLLEPPISLPFFTMCVGLLAPLHSVHAELD